MRPQWIAMTAFVVFVVFVGCSSQPNPPPGSKVNVNAPGVNVEFDKIKGNVKVDAPGVKVEVNPK